MRRITYDWTRIGGERGPAPGDMIVTHRRRDGKPTGTAYLILTVRSVVSVLPLQRVQRLALGVERMDEIAALPSEGVRRWPLFWYSR